MNQSQEVLNQMLAILQNGKTGTRGKQQFGNLIQKLRESLGLKPAEFARELRVSVQTVHRWEHGHPVLKMTWIEHFSRLASSATTGVDGSKKNVLTIQITLEILVGSDKVSVKVAGTDT